MRKLLLFLCAGALLSSFSMKVSAQIENEKPFFFGFEDGLDCLQDSSNPVDSITELRFYNGEPGDGNNKLPSSFEIAYIKDTLINIYNGIIPYVSREDSYEIVEDLDGSHEAEMQEIGAEGGKYYLKYTSGGEGSSLCADNQANLLIPGFQLEDKTSYRLVFYSKASNPEANIEAGVFRGYFNCEEPISLNGSAGNYFLLNKTQFTTDSWERNTLMFFYQNDSVANRNMYKNGYWWSATWKTVDIETGNEYDKLQQFDKYYVRMSFRYPGTEYYIDDIYLYKSTIAGAEYNDDMVRVNFGYETNLAQLAKNDLHGTIEVPVENFTVSAEFEGDPVDVSVVAAEYHTDGYLYVWLDDYLDGLDVRLSFKNPEDPNLQLKYTGTLCPNSLDTEWVEGGKVVPDFENEIVLYNPEVFALTKEFLAPVVMNSIPEYGSFNLDQDINSIQVAFSKEVYVNKTAGTADEHNPLLFMNGGNGREIWTPTDYDEENYTVTFSRPNTATSKLSGDYDVEVLNARSGDGEVYQVSQSQTFSLSFGDVSQFGEPNFIYDSEILWASAVSGSIPKGWTSCDGGHGEDGEIGTGEKAVTSGSEMIHFGAGGAFTRGFYICPRAGGVDAVFTYGANEGSEILLTEGSYWFSFKAIGWSNIPALEVYVYPMSDERPETPLSICKPENIVDWQVGSTGSYVVTEETEFRVSFDVENADNYIFEFLIPSGDNWGWGAAVIGSVVLSNQYSSAFKYIKMLTDAQSSAQALLANAQSVDNYRGQYLNELISTIDSFEGFSSTSPSDYENAAKTIKDAMSKMNGRISNVENFYAKYKAAQEKDSVFTDSIGYNQLVAYVNLVDIISKYNGIDVTVLDNDSLTAITAAVSDATQAMTNRCSQMDKFNSLKADLEKLLADNSAYNFVEEYKNMEVVYNENFELDLITATDDNLNEAINSLNSAKTSFNNKMKAAGVLTKQDKALQSLAAAYEVQVDQAVDDAMKEILEDRQDIANIYQLAIKAKLSEIMASDTIAEDGSIDMTGFIQNPSFYTTYSPFATHIPSNEDPLPGWTILGGTGNSYLRTPGSGTDKNLNYVGSANDAGVAVDWSSSIKLTQTVKNLPAGIYTLSEVCSDKGWGSMKNIFGGVYVIQLDENSDTLSVDTLHGNAPVAIEFTALGGDVQILHDYSTTNTWCFVDDMKLTLIQRLEGYDYQSAAVSADAELQEATLNVNDIFEADETIYYNLNGIRTDKPEGVNIRVTTGKNGSRKVEMVFMR
ncbi:MAG: hypothetical protein MJY66_00820 [Bacteroidaceae bacterium]|nr:hypothetical protein [Bacteroidaceae bacterium]